MITAEIAGYTYKADNYCPDCLADIARHHIRELGEDSSSTSTEALVGLWAVLEHVDREYADSNDFPVPFSLQQAEHDAGWAAHEGDSVPRCQCGNDFLGEF